jgi:thiamine kinase-like enzyme
MSTLFNIIWPILGSSGITGILIFFFKKHFERKIEHKFKQIEVSQKLQFEEAYRRQSKLFDEQFSNYKILSATTYRLKNSSRAIFRMIEIGSQSKQLKEEVKIFKSCEHILTETLYADKLIMEDSVFSVIHDLKHACASFLQTIHYYEERGSEGDIKQIEVLAGKIENAHFEALSMYKQSVETPPAILASLN